MINFYYLKSFYIQNTNKKQKIYNNHCSKESKKVLVKFEFI